jgi:hypothetical protein
LTTEKIKIIENFLTDYRMAHVIDAMTDQAVRFRLDHAARFEHQRKFSLTHDIWGNWEIRNVALYELARSLVCEAADRQHIQLREIQDMFIDVLVPQSGEYWYHSRGPGIPHQQAIFLMTPAETAQLTVYEQGPLTGQLRDEITVKQVIDLRINTWIEVPSTHYWSVTADDSVYSSIFTAYFTKEPDAEISDEDRLRQIVADAEQQ